MRLFPRECHLFLAPLGLLSGVAGLQISNSNLPQPFAIVLPRRYALGSGKPIAAVIEPAVLSVIARPFTRRPLNGIDKLEVISISLQPSHERRPLTQ